MKTLLLSLAIATAAAPPAGAADPAPRESVIVVMPRVEVVGQRWNLTRIPGSASVLDAHTLSRSRVFTANEALRKLPGLVVRDEEGFGLRPNIAVRGLNPTRSTKTTLLEDGVPLSYAPYGDNASYYHPPIERFEMVELMKGAGQIEFGPQTIGGLINYITPSPPSDWRTSASFSGGNRDYAAGKLRLGGRRMLLDLTRKTGDAARDYTDSKLNDANFKAVIGGASALTLRGSAFTERSAVTYSGLTQSEFNRLGPRYNAFRHDRFEIERYGASATHRATFGPLASLTTNLYFSRFERDWWRQSSTTTDPQGGPGVLAHRLAGDPIDVDTLRSIQGRLRKYDTWGIEPRTSIAYRSGGLAHELRAGARAHFERQDRLQVNGTSATARTGTLAESNLRKTRAYSAFLVHRSSLGAFSISPGVRFEHIESERRNRLPGGLGGSDQLNRWIPSLGATWNPTQVWTVYAGVHRGFAPPRTEDVIASAGTSTEVGPEESTNAELGARFSPSGRAELQATLFRNDFRRLIAVGSIAAGSTPLAEGEARFAGAELSGHWSHASGASLRGAWTWLGEAEQTTPFRQVVGGAVVAGSAAGRRQPYAPEQMLTFAMGWAWRGFEAQAEAVHIGSQFTDFANTIEPSADGQRGEILAETFWNLAANQTFGSSGVAAFVTVKNVSDRVMIVDRTRGIQVAAPRLVQGGLQWTFGGAH